MLGNKQFLLPLNYVRRTTGKRSMSLNEKTLIVILIVSTIITLFVILNNLPSQVNLRDETLQDLFVPKLNVQKNKQLSFIHVQDGGEHFRQHSHEFKKLELTAKKTEDVQPVIQPIEPPMPNLPNMAERREKIKSVSLHFVWLSFFKYQSI